MRGGGARVSEFFFIESKSNFFIGGRRGASGALE